MVRLPRFEYLSPSSVENACSLLKEHEGKVKVVAGGTDLLPSMKQRLFTPEHILDLRNVSGLDEIKNGSDGEVRIGSLSTMTAVEESPVVREHFSALAEAASLVGAPELRNMGTIGGNIALETRCRYFNQSHSWRKSIERCMKFGGEVCHVVKGAKRCYAFFAADTVPALIALDARIVINGADGERQCLLKEIYTNEGKTPNTLKATDIITEVILPIPGGGSGSCYKKLRLREAIDFPLVGAAAHVVMDGSKCRDAKIILGAVDSGPVEVTWAGNFLNGKSITRDVIEDVAEITQKAAQPVANTASSPGYRRKMAGVFAVRALREAITRAGAELA